MRAYGGSMGSYGTWIAEYLSSMAELAIKQVYLSVSYFLRSYELKSGFLLARRTELLNPSYTHYLP